MKKCNIFRKLLIFSVFVCTLIQLKGQDDSLAVAATQIPAFARSAFDPEPVAPFIDTLFYIKTGVGALTARDRALFVTDKIRQLSRDRFIVDSMRIYTDAGMKIIAYGDIVVMSISNADAELNDKTMIFLAQDYERIIEEAILQRKKDMELRTILFRVLLVLLIVGAQFFVFKIINFLFNKLSQKIERLKGEKIKTIKLNKYKLVDEGKTVKSILFLVRVLRLLIIVVTLYLSIPMAFSVFPATRGVAAILFGYVLNPLKNIGISIVGFIPDLFSIIVIVLVFKYLIKGLHYMADEIYKGKVKLKGFYPDWAYPTYNIIKILLYAFMFIAIYQYLPLHEYDVFKGVSVFIGIVFSLGASSVVGNVIAGLVITYMRPFKAGDRIKIGELVGNVIEKTPFVTRIRTPKNEEVTIPNSTIMSAQTFNYSESARTCSLVLHTKVSIGYDTPWRQVHELLLEAAKRTPNVLEQPEPFILQTALADFYPEYQLNVFTNDADLMPRTYSALHQNIQDVFNEANIEILSPHYHAHRDGSHRVLPHSYLPDDYQAPPFKVKIDK
ncbi:MAG: mechanosensitive ion channel family protein [Prevotellaceae bacterium]|jgi:small-conductance mechanosensitive channel|nr:mechanosensitive ion channel family protein [Prevotellaceae bacterium]